MMDKDKDQYQELVEAVRPFFPNDPIQAHAIVTQRIGPIFNDILLQLVWKHLGLEHVPDWTYAVPYEVFLQRFNMN